MMYALQINEWQLGYIYPGKMTNDSLYVSLQFSPLMN